MEKAANEDEDEILGDCSNWRQSCKSEGQIALVQQSAAQNVINVPHANVISWDELTDQQVSLTETEKSGALEECAGVTHGTKAALAEGAALLDVKVEGTLANLENLEVCNATFSSPTVAQVADVIGDNVFSAGNRREVSAERCQDGQNGSSSAHALTAGDIGDILEVSGMEKKTNEIPNVTCSNLLPKAFAPSMLWNDCQNMSTLGQTCDSCLAERSSKGPSSISNPSSISPECVIYQIKWILHCGRSCPIVLQSSNGPCPLISILNVLLLTDRLKIQSGVEYQSGESLLAQVASLILQMIPVNAPDDVLRNYEQNIQDALAVLPKSQTGLDVNVRFNGPRDYELTPDTLIFDLLNVPLVHGWLPEVGNAAQPIIEQIRSYNHLVEFVIDGHQEEANGEVVLVQEWLEQTQSQLTNAGLVAILDSVANDVPCVFFRNNHFSTIVKHDDRLFALVTDQGYANESSCVWEQISNIEGDTEFFDGRFQRRQAKNEEPIFDYYPSPPPSRRSLENSWTELLSSKQQLEVDHQLALSLVRQNHLPSPDSSFGVQRALIPSVTQSDYELARSLQFEEEMFYRRGHRGDVSSSRSSQQLQSTSSRTVDSRSEVTRRAVSSSAGGSHGHASQNMGRTSRTTVPAELETSKSKCIIS